MQVAAGCPGAILVVESPRLGFAFSGSAGLFQRGVQRALQPHDPFRAASVTKAVTAAVAVKLAEEGQWALDNPITTHVPSRQIACLHALNGHDSLDHITLRRLLNHTSGLPDYFFDEGFQARVHTEPKRMWRPEELVQAAANTGRLLFRPGTDFTYGDTGYVMVGLALENLLNRPLADVYREIILDPLGMDATYFEWHEAPRGIDVSHHYDGDRDLYDVNTSYDWAGGGLVTTAFDLVKFLRGLFGGVILTKGGLQEMTSWRTDVRWRPKSSARYLKYGLGLGTWLAYGEELIGVTGIWGAFGWYWPEGDMCIAGTLNLVGADRAALLDEIIHALKRPGQNP